MTQALRQIAIVAIGVWLGVGLLRATLPIIEAFVPEVAKANQ